MQLAPAVVQAISRVVGLLASSASLVALSIPPTPILTTSFLTSQASLRIPPGKLSWALVTSLTAMPPNLVGTSAYQVKIEKKALDLGFYSAEGYIDKLTVTRTFRAGEGWYFLIWKDWSKVTRVLSFSLLM